MNKIQNFKIKIPKLEKRKVWIGYYFNHYNAIVIYHTMPIKGTDDNSPTVYDTLDNSDKIAGCTTLEDFQLLFPEADLSEIIDNKTGNVIGMETEKLIECHLTSFWDNKRLGMIDFNMDGY